jgi:uncharacterized UBP type Zn finger protein
MKKDSSGRVQITKSIQDAIAQGSLDIKNCDHFLDIGDVTPASDGCKDCLLVGDDWVNLRLCLTCGYVGCCDNSKNKHATRHHHETNHPVIVSYEEGENWLWCYIDEVGIDP